MAINIEDEIEQRLQSELEDLYIAHSSDKEFYGLPLNEYNPEILVDCFVDGSKTMPELLIRLELLTEMMRDLAEVGWELTVPVQDGVISTDWRGEGKPPTEYSMFDASGYDLDGNHVDDMDDIIDEEEE